MRRAFLLLVLGVVWAPFVQAAVSVTARAAVGAFALGEPIIIEMLFRGTSGVDGYVVTADPSGRPPPMGLYMSQEAGFGFPIARGADPSRPLRHRLLLNKWMTLDQPGRYTVTVDTLIGGRRHITPVEINIVARDETRLRQTCARWSEQANGKSLPTVEHPKEFAEYFRYGPQFQQRYAQQVLMYLHDEALIPCLLQSASKSNLAPAVAFREMDSVAGVDALQQLSRSPVPELVAEARKRLEQVKERTKKQNVREAAAGVLHAIPVASVTGAKAARSATLEIYFIDVEGGQSTLIVTPQKRSLLIDAGWAGEGTGFKPGDPRKARDANRIVAAARDAGVSQIDYLLITHFHTDHFGGVSELAQLMPIRGFVDHGAPHPRASQTSKDTRDAYALYSALRSKAGTHIQPKPGERLPLSDVAVTVVSSGGETLSKPLPGTTGSVNSACPQKPIPAGDRDENPRSTGVLVRHGKFRFLNVGDLSGQPLFDLVCPKNLVGPVDAYLTAHHGGADAAEPATLAAFRPRVVMMNNAPGKGGQRAMFEVLRQSKVENVWQLHRSLDAGNMNFPAEYIANVDDSDAHWIKLVAKEDGSFSVLNARTGQTKRYPAR